VPVGHRLAEERRRQGKSLPEVERATKIMGRLLDALEAERWTDLPPSAYVRGYIQNYAQFLGLEPGPLLEEYSRDVGPKPEKAPIRRIPQQAVVPHHREVHNAPRRLRVAIAIGVVVLALAVWAVASFARRDEEPPPVPPDTTSATVEPTSSTPAQGVVTPVEPTATDTQSTPAAQPFVLGVAVADGKASWVRVTVDGAVVFEGTLSGGTAEEWEVAEEATVRIGKPASVTVTRDGTVVEVPLTGGIGEVTVRADD